MDFFLPPVVFSVGSFNDPSFNQSPFLPLRRLQRWLEREVQPKNTTISGTKIYQGFLFSRKAYYGWVRLTMVLSWRYFTFEKREGGVSWKLWGQGRREALSFLGLFLELLYSTPLKKILGGFMCYIRFPNFVLGCFVFCIFRGLWSFHSWRFYKFESSGEGGGGVHKRDKRAVWSQVFCW